MTNSEQMYETGRGVVAVIPTYCEVESLPGLLSRVHAVLPELNVLIVDDSSPDGTGEWVREQMESDSRLHLHTRPAKSDSITSFRWTPMPRTVQRIFLSFWSERPVQIIRIW